ncbi:multidrug effflux MFS transporter [Cellvibrio sp. PSBB006]|uniref:multidrug effflux MFS transporter n=1 Tax=Cellvibrio sp. PSBB006 TaxID=1987723 RepID=UPI000B3B7DE7|nr:multidrug effflux MFS transporter [Cellvibrio sp. PSBB006]ARU28532.1 Bcr/CflA family drug resistance efflux transporter [Cellvibrio sp. PSBB006]
MTEKSLSPWLILLLAAMIATTPLAVDMYLPAMPAMAHDLNTHIGTVQQSLSIFLAAYGAGMLLFGPLADALGRRPLALFGLSGFALASLMLSWVESIEWFLTWRTIQALSGAASSVVVPGIIRYLYREHTAKGMSYMSMIMMLAPLLAPALGSAIMWLNSWHFIFIAQAGYAAVIIFFAWRFLPEIKAKDSSRRVNFLQGYRTVFANYSARPLIVTITCSSFAFFCFLTAIPFIYIKYFGVSEQLFGILFGVNVMMLMLANFINSRVVSRVGSPRMLRIGLGIALISASLLCLFNYLDMNLWYTVFTVGPLMASLGLISTNTDAMIIMKFPDHSGTATAVTGTLRFGSGAIAGPLLAWLYTGTAMPFSLLMLAGVLGVLCCQIWIFLRTAQQKTE